MQWNDTDRHILLEAIVKSQILLIQSELFGDSVDPGLDCAESAQKV